MRFMDSVVMIFLFALAGLVITAVLYRAIKFLIESDKKKTEESKNSPEQPAPAAFQPKNNFEKVLGFKQCPDHGSFPAEKDRCWCGKEPTDTVND